MNEKPASNTIDIKKVENNNPDLIKEEAKKLAEKKVFKAGVIDLQELADAESRDIGDNRMTEDKEDRSKNWLTRNLKRIWKHNLAQEYYRQREISKVKKQILETGNLYAGQDANADPTINTKNSDEAKKAVIEKFTSQYADEILREEEKNSKIEATPEVNNALKDLIKSYASGSINEATFKNRKDDLIFAHNPNYAQEGKLYADNLLEIAKEIKDAASHGEALDQMDFDIQLTLGKARESLDTEAKKTTFDKILNSKLISKTMLGQALAQTGIIAGAYALTRYVLVDSTRKAAKWAGFGAGLAVNAGIEAAKERARVTRERSQHIRERAKGMQFTEDDMKRREQMEKNRYETKSATDIIANLDNALSKVERGNLGREEIRSIMENLSDFEARVRYGNKEKIDLISYGSFEKVEKDRTAMLVKAAELKVALRNAGLELNGDFNSNLEALVDAHEENFTTEKTQKDEIFRKMRNEKMWRKAGQSLLVGAGISFVAQEVTSAFTKEDGLIEGSVKSIRNHFDGTPGKDLAHDTTAMESLRRWALGDNPRMPFGNGVDYNINGEHIHLPEGVSLVQHPDGHGYDLIANGKTISGIDFDSNGNLTPEAIKVLHNSDIYTNESIVGGPVVEKTVTYNSAEEYINNHPELTHKIHRDLWYENDTKPFDQNELRGWWGGANNTGIDQNGNYIFNMSHMTNDGSFHLDQSIDAKNQIDAGKLKMAFSLSRDTQFNVFEVDIDKNGNAIISKDSELAKAMFKNVDGHAVFTGKFAEVAQSMGTAEDGGENLRILATHIGEDKANLEDIIKDGDGQVKHIRFDIPLDSEIEPPIPIPPIPRRPMEQGEYKKDDKEKKQGPAKGQENLKTYTDKPQGINDIQSESAPISATTADEDNEGVVKNNKNPNPEKMSVSDVNARFSEMLNQQKSNNEVPPSASVMSAPEINPETESEIISDKEYNDFVDNNKVTKRRLNQIAKKIIDKKSLTPRENAIFVGKTKEINEIIVGTQKQTA